MKWPFRLKTSIWDSDDMAETMYRYNEIWWWWFATLTMVNLFGWLFFDTSNLFRVMLNATGLIIADIVSRSYLKWRNKTNKKTL